MRSRRLRQPVDPAQAQGDAARSCARACRRTACRPARGRGPPRSACRAARPATGARARRASSALVKVPSANGRRRRSPSSRSTCCRASAAKNGLMSIPTDCACQSRFHRSARPLPQPRSTTRSPGPGARNARSMSLRIFDPSSGGDTRSCRASAWSASSRYFVCSSNVSCGRRSRKSFDGPPYCVPHDWQVSAERLAGERAVTCRASHEREQRRRNHVSFEHFVEQPLETLGAARPRVLTDVVRLPAPPAARRAPDRS